METLTFSATGSLPRVRKYLNSIHFDEKFYFLSRYLEHQTGHFFKDVVSTKMKKRLILNFAKRRYVTKFGSIEREEKSKAQTVTSEWEDPIF